MTTYEVIHVAATSKFTAFKQRSWNMKIDSSILGNDADYQMKSLASPASHSLLSYKCD